MPGRNTADLQHAQKLDVSHQMSQPTSVDMCYLIHVGVPSWYESSVEAPREFHIERHHNASIEAAIGSEFAVPQKLTPATRDDLV